MILRGLMSKRTWKECGSPSIRECRDEMHPSDDHFGIEKAKGRQVSTIIEPNMWKTPCSPD